MDISIILPIYNGEKYLTESLESVRKNIETLEAEVFLIDDGSTDGSTEIAKFYAENCPGFKYYRTENSGPSRARNFAVSMATGKYLYFMDADDVLVDGILDRMFRLSEKNKTDLTMCNVARLEGNKISIAWGHNRAFYNLTGHITHIRKHPNLVYDTTLWNKLILRDFYLKIGITFLDGYRYADIPVTLAMHYHANGVSVIRSTGYLWRIRTDDAPQITRILNMKSLTDKIDILTRALDFAKNTISDPEILKALQIKILDIDFDPFINKMYLMDKEEALPYMKRIAGFIDSQIDLTLLEEIPLKKRQTNKYIMQGDYERLVQTVNYITANYSKAPIIETEKGLHVLLPENIFSIRDRRVEKEFINVSPSCFIDFVRINGSNVTLFGHSYYWRISMPSGTDQKLKACLLNEKTGASASLDIRPSDSSYLTKEKGLLLNYDDYTYYKYDYDGAGFRIDIDFETLSGKEELQGENVIQVSYENRIGSGVTLLRGAVKDVKDAFKSFSYSNAQYQGAMETDRQNIVVIRWTTLQKEETGLNKIAPKRPNDTLILQKLREEQKKYKSLRNSKSYKIGRALTWIPRKIRDML
jgi:CDP-glycerol glycerophosphotransferase